MSFRPPPSYCHKRGPLTADEHRAAEAEGTRQADSFYPCRGIEQHALTIAMCQTGVEKLIRKGIVRVRHDRCFFWNGEQGCFRLYDHEQNAYFLRMMSGFRCANGTAQLVIGVPNAYLN